METQEKVIKILIDLTGNSEMCLNDRLQQELGMDSLGLVTLLIELEDSFHITLDETDMDPFQLTTVADVVALVQKYGGDSDVG